MSPLRDAAVRRFAVLGTASVLWKLAALAVFLAVVIKLSGGGGP